MQQKQQQERSNHPLHGFDVPHSRHHETPKVLAFTCTPVTASHLSFRIGPETSLDIFNLSDEIYCGLWGEVLILILPDCPAGSAPVRRAVRVFRPPAWRGLRQAGGRCHREPVPERTPELKRSGSWNWSGSQREGESVSEAKAQGDVRGLVRTGKAARGFRAALVQRCGFRGGRCEMAHCNQSTLQKKGGKNERSGTLINRIFG
jgi:hypothetical protein